MGAYTEIVDFTFTANETSRTFSGLSITKDDFVKIVVTHVNGSASNSRLSIFPNTNAGVSGFNTQTNYHLQTLIANNTSVSAVRSNQNEITFTPGTSSNYNLIYFKLSENNRANFFCNNFRTLDSSLNNRFFYVTSSGVTFPDAITSFTFSTTQTGGIGTGSRIQIYRLDAVKEADITVASNTTQVDISNLSIDKDSEYLLVSDISIAANGNFRLHFNDILTTTSFFRQDISAGGSSSFADRRNEPQYASTGGSGTKALIYTHIKLSNIGAGTSQSYMIGSYGTSSMFLQNSFISTTAENLTEITKLNVVAANTNAIGTGSRFILYKLYE